MYDASSSCGMVRGRRERPGVTGDEGPGGVACVLRAFGRELAAERIAQTATGFSGIPEADALLGESPEAFLLGVLFTQGVPAERAWAGPHMLKKRLGHLDLERLSGEPESVVRAITERPALHRFVKTLPVWIASAARRLLTDYAGDASRIWPDGAHVLEVTERLLAFDGIGQKKAVMTVEILRRHFGVFLAGAERGGVAYDVHVRRVFLRSGLVSVDTPDAVRDAARAASPDEPGLLDLATWTVGRRWCRPRDPQCADCLLSEVCPRLVERSVSGVGGPGHQSSERSSSPESSLG